MLALLSSVLMIAVPVYINGHSTDAPTESWASGLMDFWAVRLVLNVVGYATILLPAGLIVWYLKRTKYNERAGFGCFPKIIRLCVFGNDYDTTATDESGVKKVETKPEERSVLQTFLLLAFCFVGLQSSYLTWGLLQERIMTHKYGGGDGVEGVRFKNSQFLVFMNRILAFIIAVIVMFITKQNNHKAPLYKYSLSSFSNIMSSWFQYEALKFVSFPTQVLAKASKIIPVMLMGKFVSKKTYDWFEYATAIMISAGTGMFLLTSKDNSHPNTVTTFSGILLLVGYMVFDSFTSNWQGELFTQYKMSSIQMMAGVNLFSVLLTSISLLEQAGFVESIEFMLKYPEFMLHVTILSVCSASGQLFIFFTISKFGPVSFVIIMTMRQGFAILLSCLIYHHPVTIVGVSGIFVVFIALFLRIYFSRRKKLMAKKQTGKGAENGKV